MTRREIEVTFAQTIQSSIQNLRIIEIISTARKYNPPFFQYIYWIVTFVKLNGLWGRKSMADSSFYLLRLLGV
jgi:hypothetical protein